MGTKEQGLAFSTVQAASNAKFSAGNRQAKNPIIACVCCQNTNKMVAPQGLILGQQSGQVLLLS